LLEIQLQEAHHPKAMVHHLPEVRQHKAMVHHLQEVHNKAVAHHLPEIRHNKVVVVRNVHCFGIKHGHLTISNNHHKKQLQKVFYITYYSKILNKKQLISIKSEIYPKIDR
jgi:uncharacterized protein YifN (PemK superfamily)